MIRKYSKEEAERLLGGKCRLTERHIQTGRSKEIIAQCISGIASVPAYKAIKIYELIANPNKWVLAN